MSHLNKVLYSADLLNNDAWPGFCNCLLPDQQFKAAALTFQFPVQNGSVAELQKRQAEYTYEVLSELEFVFKGELYAMFVASSQSPISKLFEFMGIWKDPSLKALLKNVKKGEVSRMVREDQVYLAAIAKFEYDDLDALTECIGTWGVVLPFIARGQQSLSSETAATLYGKLFPMKHKANVEETRRICWPYVAYYAAESDLLVVRFESSLNTYGVLFDVYGRQQTVEKIYRRFAQLKS
jgi:hypothetical protein